MSDTINSINFILATARQKKKLYITHKLMYKSWLCMVELKKNGRISKVVHNIV